MKILSPNWFAEPPIDCEQKRYVLLDYLQNVHSEFRSDKLYPSLTDVIYQIKNLETWSHKRELFKGEVKGLDFTKMTLLYDTPENTPEMAEIDKIVDYSISEINSIFKYGRKVWRKIENSLVWNTVGLIPNYKLEGYMLIKVGKEVNIYRYKMSEIFSENMIELKFMDKEEIGLKPYDYIKEKLIKNGELPNPLTISVESPDFPLDESVLPIVKTLSFSKIYRLDNPCRCKKYIRLTEIFLRGK